MRIADGQNEVLALHRRPVANALDLQVLAKAIGHADDHVGQQRPRQPVQRAVLPLVVRPADEQFAVLALDRQIAGEDRAQLTSWALDADRVIPADRDLDVARHRDRPASNSRHCLFPLSR
jgi:hypothetical protein